MLDMSMIVNRIVVILKFIMDIDVNGKVNECIPSVILLSSAIKLDNCEYP